MSTPIRLQMPLKGRRYTSWGQGEPPAGLPEDLVAIYKRTYGMILYTENMLLEHERFPLVDMAEWCVGLKQDCKDFRKWIVAQEIDLRAYAPDVLTTLDTIYDIVWRAVQEIARCITLIEGRAVDPDDRSMLILAGTLSYDRQAMALAHELRQADQLNQVTLIDATPQKVSNAWDSLERMRTQLCEWAKRRGDQRLTFDQGTWTITLDASEFNGLKPKAFLVYKAIFENPHITRQQLRIDIPGIRGDKTIPKLLATLPNELHQTVGSDNSGYWITLPTLTKKNPQRAVNDPT